MKTLVLSLAFAALSAAGAPAALAQSDSNGADASAEQSQSRFSNGELRAFAAAAMAVQDIRDAFLTRLATMSDQGEREQFRHIAAAHMAEAVQRQGLSVARFAQILSAAQNDETLAARINEQLNAPDDAADELR